jgi:hypothetical protein
MHQDPEIDLHLDPLGELEVQRALALARARETYPAVPRETLLGYCEAAWDVALKADPRRRDLQRSFDRALLIIAWTQRRSGGRVPLRELVDQTVPRIALEPFISEPRQPALAEPQPEVRVQESVAVAPAPPVEPVVELEIAPTTMVIEVSALIPGARSRERGSGRRP